MSTLTVRNINLLKVSSHAKVYGGNFSKKRQEKTLGKQLFYRSVIYHFFNIFSAPIE